MNSAPRREISWDRRPMRHSCFANGLLGTFLVGVAVATFFSGSQFSLNEMNSVTWATGARGLEAALSPFNLSLGLTVFFLARVLGLLYFQKTIDNENIITRTKKALLYNAIPFVVFFLLFAVWLMLREGFAVNPDTGEVFMEPYKYLHNLLAMPLVLVMFLLGVLGVLAGIAVGLLREWRRDLVLRTGYRTGGILPLHAGRIQQHRLLSSLCWKRP